MVVEIHRMVYVNQIRPQIQLTPAIVATNKPAVKRNWEAPTIEHHIINMDESPDKE